METNICLERLLTEIWVPDPYDETHLYYFSESSSSIGVQLDLALQVENVIKYTTADGDSSVMDRSIVDKIFVQFPEFDYYDIFMSSDTFGEAFSGLFASMGVDSTTRDLIIHHIVEYSRRIRHLVSQMTMGMILPMRANFILRTEYELFEPQGWGMIPATTTSIRSLKTENHVGDQNDDQKCCVICLEELVPGSQVTSMPCSHLFHGSCITTWLEKSHVCPICRFQMPTSNSN